MTTIPNPYSPPSGTHNVDGTPARSTFITLFAAIFVLTWILGLHLYSLYLDGFQLQNMVFEYSGDGWLWNLVVRLPYLAAIQFALLILYARSRRKRGLLDARPRLSLACLLGLFAGIFSTLAYDLIRMIPEDVFGLTISWTPHYIIIWAAYAVTTIVIMEPLFLQLRVNGQDGDTDEPSNAPEYSKVRLHDG